MIYCNLKGGLGNMLFQIAATMEFSRKFEVDFSFPNLNTHKRLFDGKKIIKEYHGVFDSLKCIQPKIGTKKINFPFHYVDWHIPKECIIEGFFQSEKYFKNSREKILNVFPQYHKLTNKVSVHVRRGDFLKKQQYHNILTLEYYKKAFSIFSNERFLIFSDDIEWCKKKFIGKEFSFHETQGDMADIAIMSSCKHNIVANSSFSWWGAWLNRSKGKKVICPSQWVGPALKNLNTNDIYCEEWVRI